MRVRRVWRGWLFRWPVALGMGLRNRKKCRMALVRTINRPILIPWSDNTVRILDTTSALPLAYVSLGLRRVYVENMVRDQVIGLLNAHVSVSTGLWRIPLPGDRPEQPLIPGDTSREFEVAEIWDWDLKADPTEGDFRIMPGAGVRTSIHFSCQPISGKEEWYSADKVDYKYFENV